MIETDNRRAVHGTRDNRDEWLADLAGVAGNRDVYAERREINAYGASGVLRSREADMTDRFGRDGYGSRDSHYEASVKHAPASHDDDYYDDYQGASAKGTSAYLAEEEPDPQWTYDEKREQWVDRDGNPYVEAYAEGEEERYAPGDDEYLAPRADVRLPRRKSRGGAVSLAALVLVASIGGGFAYVWKKGGFVGSDLPGIGSAPPVIRASSDPVKIKPAETVAVNNPPTREIFDRSNQSAPVANERLVRHEEQPVAVVPIRTEGAPAAAAPDATRPVTTSNITLPSSDNAATTDQTSAAGNVADLSAGDPPGGPRRVRTIKIMPDNSVVTGEAPITATDPVPSTRSVDVATIVPPSPQTPAAPTQTSTSAPSSEPMATAPAAPVTTIPADTPATSATVDDDANATTIAEPAPQAEASPPAEPPVRPRNIPATSAHSASSSAQVASAEPAMPASNGAYVVQVSSQKTPADAQAAFQSLQRKYGAVLGGMKSSIRKVELPERGTYYRVRVGSWSSSTEAANFCAKLKAAGGDCVIARN